MHLAPVSLQISARTAPQCHFNSLFLSRFYTPFCAVLIRIEYRGVIWSQMLHDQRRPFIHNATIRQSANILFFSFVYCQCNLQCKTEWKFAFAAIQQYMEKFISFCADFVCTFIVVKADEKLSSSLCRLTERFVAVAIAERPLGYQNFTAKCCNYAMTKMRTKISRNHLTQHQR